MWGYKDDAERDQELVDKGGMLKPEEKKIGLVWSKHGLIWFMETGTKEKRYLGALRLKKKTLSPETYKRLLRGARIMMKYDATVAEEENHE